MYIYIYIGMISTRALGLTGRCRASATRQSGEVQLSNRCKSDALDVAWQLLPLLGGLYVC